MKCPSASIESLTSRLKVFISFSVYMTIDPGTSSAVASSSCLVELFSACHFLGRVHRIFLFLLPPAKVVFYASPRICGSFQNREEPLIHFEKRSCFFLAFQKVTLVLKTVKSDIVENFFYNLTIVAMFTMM